MGARPRGICSFPTLTATGAGSAMYFDPFAATGPESSTDMFQPDRSTIERLMKACVLEAFPELAISETRVECTGGDHVLLIVDERHAFRFPRPGTPPLTFEIAVLRLLDERVPLATPSYEYVDPKGRFAGYKFIDGRALTQARFAQLAAPVQETLLDQLAAFLTILHQLRPTEIVYAGELPTGWTLADFVERGRRDRLPRLAARWPQLAEPMRCFYDGIEGGHVRSTIIHGDLVAEHILVDDRTAALTGIIDFGDVALGDPAQDLIGLWAYGAAAAAHVVARYDPQGIDACLLARSRDHFIRYRLDRLFEQLVEGDPAVDGAMAELAPFLVHFETVQRTT